MYSTGIHFTSEAQSFFGLAEKSHHFKSMERGGISSMIKQILGAGAKYLLPIDENIDSGKHSCFDYRLWARIPIAESPNPACVDLLIEVASVTTWAPIRDPASLPVEEGPTIGEQPVDISISDQPLGKVQKVPRDT